jgi:hypothetical protein
VFPPVPVPELELELFQKVELWEHCWTAPKKKNTKEHGGDSERIKN